MASILYVFISTLALFLGASAEIVDVFIDHKVTDWRTGIEFGPFHIHKETGIDSLGKQEFKNCGGAEMDFTLSWKPPGTLKIGETYTFNIQTTAAHDMTDGVAFPHLYYNDQLIINTKVHFCDLIPKEYKVCPVKKGEKLNVSVGATIDKKTMFPGRYHGNCTVFNEKSEEMMCVTADCTLN